MRNTGRFSAGFIAIAALCAVVAGSSRNADAGQQYPIMDAIAGRVIQKYQGSTCEQLWQERSTHGQPKSPQQQEAINLLRNNPDVRAAFLNKVAGPIANKMFECGMIP